MGRLQSPVDIDCRIAPGLRLPVNARRDRGRARGIPLSTRRRRRPIRAHRCGGALAGQCRRRTVDTWAVALHARRSRSGRRSPVDVDTLDRVAAADRSPSDAPASLIAEAVVPFGARAPMETGKPSEALSAAQRRAVRSARPDPGHASPYLTIWPRSARTSRWPRGPNGKRRWRTSGRMRGPVGGSIRASGSRWRPSRC